MIELPCNNCGKTLATYKNPLGALTPVQRGTVQGLLAMVGGDVAGLVRSLDDGNSVASMLHVYCASCAEVCC